MSVHNHDPFKAAAGDAQPDWAAPYEFARKIVLAARESSDRRVSYSQLWEHLHGQPPHYPSFFRKFSKPFTQLGSACITLELPYINALIVDKSTRKPSKAAIENMAEFIKSHGIVTGRNAREYLEEQADLAAAITLQDLDKAFSDFEA
jgi:hypothetical protein